MFKYLKTILSQKIRNVVRDELKRNSAFRELVGILNGTIWNSQISIKSKITPPSKIVNSTIGDYTYISEGSILNNVTIKKFCSIGPNLLAGYGIHPIDGISTSPMFYSTVKQNGVTFSASNKVDEYKSIDIGNDVFIGANVTILDGVTIGHGAVIGAGAVVSKDIPPYAVAVGSPIRIIKYRFEEDTIQRLLEIKWWEWDEERLKDVEKYFHNMDDFLRIHTP